MKTNGKHTTDMHANATPAAELPNCPWCGHPCQTAWDNVERCEVIDCPHCGFRVAPNARAA
jgi:DNA-directed RNA polymerase subunit RPC12/RpoP